MRSLWMFLIAMLFLSDGNSAAVDDHRTVMYLTGQHDVVPTDQNLLQDVTHVVLAFIRSDIFNVDKPPTEFPLFTTIESVRSRFPTSAKVQIAIGGWGDDGFEQAAKTPESRRRWAGHVRAMVDALDIDGIDIDWEYPGGNRDDYKLIPNSERVWEIAAFVALLTELRTALGKNKILSIAVPAVERDLMAFTTKTLPQISEQVDFINVMTYDMMIRRDSVVKHHSGVSESYEAMKRYTDRGAPPSKLNFGLGYYVKWFVTTECDPDNVLGCDTQLLEDPETGNDLGGTGAFSWHDEVPKELSSSFERAKSEGYDFNDGSHGFWDAQEKLWWSFDTPKSIERKINELITTLGIGGVFAWGIGEDAPDFVHFKATVEAMRSLATPPTAERDEL